MITLSTPPASGRQRYAARPHAPIGGEPFQNAEEAWLWGMQCLVARDEGARIQAGLALTPRPCDPEDIVVAAERLRRAGRLTRRHLAVLTAFGRGLLPPDGRLRTQELEARLWDEALDQLTTVLRQKGIVA